MGGASTSAESLEAPPPLEGGAFVAVVGPSGAGKDTVIGYARAALAGEPRADFVRRVITRPADLASEDHDTLAEAAFAEAEAKGAFALSWRAHGLGYGLPVAIDAAIGGGRVVVANVSRAIVPALRDRYANVVVVEITAPPQVLAGRLAARGRESQDDVLARLARNAALAPAADVHVLDNSGPREAAGERFVAILRAAVDEASRRG